MLEKYILLCYNSIIIYKYALLRRAGVAQLVEQCIRNAWVGGSSPFTSSKSTQSAFYF